MVFVIAVLLYFLDVISGAWGLALVIAAGIFELAETGFWFWLSKRRRVQVGAETLIGAPGEVAGGGLVRVGGELWQMRADGPLVPGDEVRVVGRDDLVLEVERTAGRAPSGRT
jgi:membrane protein implicated in regulation of membrane protease activity